MKKYLQGFAMYTNENYEPVTHEHYCNIATYSEYNQKTKKCTTTTMQVNKYSFPAFLFC